MASHARNGLVRLTREYFEPLYGYPLSDADINEIIDSLATYGAVLKEIKNGLDCTKSDTEIPVSFPQNAQVTSVASPHTFPKTGQLK
jgi:hypothetical protein